MNNKERIIESLHDLQERLSNVDLAQDELAIAEAVMQSIWGFTGSLELTGSLWMSCDDCCHSGCDLEYSYEDRGGCILFKENNEEDDE